MDSSRFDALTRAFARPASRRQTLAGVVAAALAPVVAAAQTEPAKCLAQGKRCQLAADQGAGHDHGKHGGKGGKSKRHRPSCANCCSRYGAAGSDGKVRCSCKSEGIGCDNDSQCCSGQCRDNACTACPPGTVFCPDGCADLQTDPNHCGSCETACASGQRCQNGRCVCDERSCPDGCCDAAGTCQRGTSDGACGAGGERCAICQAPAFCRQQACCMPDCAGKQCGDSDTCGGVCTACPDECQMCTGGVCKPKDNGTPCGGAGSGLRCCHGACPPPPTCVQTGTCCTHGTTCADCCGVSSNAAHSRCLDTNGYSCEASDPELPCHTDADCTQFAGAAICRCGICCRQSGGTCFDPADCCSGTCNSDGTCA